MSRGRRTLDDGFTKRGSYHIPGGRAEKGWCQQGGVQPGNSGLVTVHFPERLAGQHPLVAEAGEVDGAVFAERDQL